MKETEMTEMTEMIEMSEISEAVVESVEEAVAPADPENKSEIDVLRAEIEMLRTELKTRDELQKATSRMETELAEFEEYFPDVKLTEIPNDIWEKVKGGESLSSSFALYERKRELERKKIGDFNEKNRRMSTGSLAQGEGEKYYSPSEVRKMTPEQVKHHYDEIIESMRHWN